MKIDYIATAEDNGVEILKILYGKFRMSHQMVKKLKFHGTVELNGRHAIVRETLKEGDSLHLELLSGNSLSHPDGITFYHEDEWYVVVSKPSGIVTHPTHGHLDDSLITRLSDDTLHPVIRLDRETSGLILIARNGYAHNTLSLYGDLHKKYLAVCYGRFAAENGTIDEPIARRPGSVMIRDVSPSGKRSVTHYNVLFYDEVNDLSLVEFVLETGRCHQIRVHSTYTGHPLAGDGLYGPNSIDNPDSSFEGSEETDRKIGRCALHAYYLSMYDPFAKTEMVFKDPLPEDMRRAFSDPELVDEILREIY
ncbi:23S rRNA pseudouridine1911/1915/1917 synthase [Ruminococcaceae bacterium YRB3002]|nr:23S rRNA pseudouridine1911/1915/1917 synthase [Ruminococcaceae bacterium YRB3002]